MYCSECFEARRTQAVFASHRLTDRPSCIRLRMRRFLLGFLIGAISVVGFSSDRARLEVTDPLAKADAIVAISGDTGAEANIAIALWKQGYARFSFLGRLERSWHRWLRRLMSAPPSPRRSGERDPRGRRIRDHRENAQRVAELMRSKGAASAIL